MFFLRINFIGVNFIISRHLFTFLFRSEVHVGMEALINTTWQPSWERSPTEVLLVITAGQYHLGVLLNYLFF